MTDTAENAVAAEATEAPQAETPAQEAVAPEAQAPAAEAPAAEAPAAEQPAPNPLARTVEFSISVQEINGAALKKLRKFSKTARMDGFRPGHVPFATLQRQYGQQFWQEAHEELLDEAYRAEMGKLEEAKVQVAGVIGVEPKAEQGAPAERIEYVATYEVLPEFESPKFDGIEFVRSTCEVTDKNIEDTILVIRKQNATYTKVERAAADSDRVAVDFRGTENGVAFDGGTANDFHFVLGEGQMLPEFEGAIRGMSAGEEKTFPLTFPENYGAANLAGKAVEFWVKVNEVAECHLAEIDDEFAKKMGVPEGAERMLADIRTNVERQVEYRLQRRNKDVVMEKVLEVAKDVPLPVTMVERERQDMLAAFKEDMARQGMKMENFNPPAEAFKEDAEKRTRLGLVVPRLIAENQLVATEEELRAQAVKESIAYENPEATVEELLKNKETRTRLIGWVTENKFADWVFAQGQTTDKAVSFSELMEA